MFVFYDYCYYVLCVYIIVVVVLCLFVNCILCGLCVVYIWGNWFVVVYCVMIMYILELFFEWVVYWNCWLCLLMCIIYCIKVCILWRLYEMYCMYMCYVIVMFGYVFDCCCNVYCYNSLLVVYEVLYIMFINVVKIVYMLWIDRICL